ncbi:MAG: hypothetical protein GXP38_12785, partial [Chloroflexi bacterium]|nr:hypothetical protein [Chloroflexota bacterium]
TAALGVPFFWKSAHSLGGAKLAVPASWIFALYPESILQGSSQMREPFLITFVAMAFWGLLDWQANNNRKAWLWFGSGLAGMLLFSPAIALVTLLILGGWLWFSKEHRRVSWRMILAVSVVFLVGLFLLSWSLNRQGVFGTQSPFGVIADWFGRAVKWDVHQLERGSGWVQKLFGEMGTTARLLFVTGYGLAQPVLPATFIEPTTLTWHVIGILRALGWYLFAPLLIYGFFAALKSTHKRERNTWLWLGIATWTWVLIASLRAGGDQWDNPRYRVIFLAFQALFAGYAWAWWRGHRDAWLPRLLAVEVVFLVFFTQWYANRYYDIFGQLPFWTMVAWITGLSGFILAGGWLWDRWQMRKKSARLTR